MSILSNLMVTFGVKSEESREDLSAIEQTLDGMHDTLGKIRDSEAFSNLLQGLNLSILDNARDKLSSFGQELSNQVDLSSSLESKYIEAEKSLQQMKATMGLTGKEAARMRRKTSFFESLQMDSEAVQKTWLRLHDSGLKLSNLDFGGLQEFMKFTNVAGVKGPKMVQMFERMTKQLGFTAKGARRLVDQTLAIGQAFNVGTEFLKKMPEYLAGISEHYSKVFQSASPDKIRKLTRGTMQMAGALEEAGFSTEKAVNMATKSFQHLEEQQLKFNKMLAGASDMPEEVKNQLKTLGRVDMTKNPIKFARRLRKEYRSLEGQQRRYVQQELLNELPQGIRAIVTKSMPNLTKSLRKGEKALRDAKGAANELADAYRTTRTIQERYDRQQELFTHHVHQLSRELGVTGDMLKLQRQAYDAYEDKLKEFVHLTDKGGGKVRFLGTQLRKASGEVTALGQATEVTTEAWIAYKTAGIRGATLALVEHARKAGLLTEKMKKQKGVLAGMFGTIAQGLPEVLTMVAAADVAGLPGAGLLGPLMPVALFGGGLYALEHAWKGGVAGFVKDARAFLDDKIPELAARLRKDLPKYRREIASTLNAVIDGLPTILKGGAKLWPPVRDFFVNLVDQIEWGELWTSIEGLATSIGAGLLALFERVPWRAVGRFIAVQTGHALEWLGKHVPGPLIAGARALIGGAFDAVWSWAADPDKSVHQKAKEAGTVLAGAVGLGIALAPGAVASGLASALGSISLSSIASGVMTVGSQGLFGALSGAMPTLSFAGLASGASKALKFAKGVYAIAAALKFVWELSTEIIPGMVQMWSGGHREMERGAWRMARGSAEALNWLFLGIPELLGWASERFLKWAEGTSYDATLAFRRFFKFMQLSFEGLLLGAEMFLTALPDMAHQWILQSASGIREATLQALDIVFGMLADLASLVQQYVPGGAAAFQATTGVSVKSIRKTRQAVSKRLSDVQTGQTGLAQRAREEGEQANRALDDVMAKRSDMMREYFGREAIERHKSGKMGFVELFGQIKPAGGARRGRGGRSRTRGDGGRSRTRGDGDAARPRGPMGPVSPDYKAPDYESPGIDLGEVGGEGTAGDSAAAVASVNKQGFSKMITVQSKLLREIKLMRRNMRKRQRQADGGGADRAPAPPDRAP